jgi:hypothetical protein
MVAFAHSETHTVLGTLTNGLKIVSTVMTVTNTESTTATPITISPLTRIIKFIAGTQTVTTGGIMGWVISGTYPNIINATPAGSAHDDIFEIVSIGI